MKEGVLQDLANEVSKAYAILHGLEASEVALHCLDAYLDMLEKAGAKVVRGGIDD